MQINKALITAAGPGQSALPLQRLVDRDGVEKTALEMILGKVAKAGIESVAIVISPGNEAAYRSAAGSFIDRLTFVTQSEPTGYGQAILCAKSFLGDAPFLHLVGDHLYLSSQKKRLRQAIDRSRVGRRMFGLRRTSHTRNDVALLWGNRRLTVASDRAALRSETRH